MNLNIKIVIQKLIINLIEFVFSITNNYCMYAL